MIEFKNIHSVPTREIIISGSAEAVC